MFSILIPAYDYDCGALIAALRQQCEQLAAEDGDFDYEILSDAIRGRAHARNVLADRAKGDYFIFLDADAAVTPGDNNLPEPSTPSTFNFVRNYWQARHETPVVVGGIATPATVPDARGRQLRLRYEQDATRRRTPDYRCRHPYDCFATFNFMITREAFRQVGGFDEACREYGYEDTLLGVRLQENDIAIRHIDNPLYHMGIDLSEEYLRKVEASLRTLHGLGEPMQSHAGVSRAARRLQRLHLDSLFRNIYQHLRSRLVGNLLSENPSLLLLKFYKLGYYLAL